MGLPPLLLLSSSSSSSSSSPLLILLWHPTVSSIINFKKIRCDESKIIVPRMNPDVFAPYTQNTDFLLCSSTVLEQSRKSVFCVYGANTSGFILGTIILDSSQRIFYKLITEETEETVG